jgi:hypothetical protein
METSSATDNWIVPCKEFLEEYNRLNLSAASLGAFLELLRLISQAASRLPFSLLPGMPLSRWDVPARAEVALIGLSIRDPGTISIPPRWIRLPGTDRGFIYLVFKLKVYLVCIEPPP